MYKIKIFEFATATTSIADSEKVINFWLEKNPHLEYANVNPTNEDAYGKIKYVITYKLKNLEE